MYEVSFEKMEAVIAPDVWGDIANAVNNFVQGLLDGLENGIAGLFS